MGMERIQKVILSREGDERKKKKNLHVYTYTAKMYNFMSPVHEFISMCYIDVNKN